MERTIANALESAGDRLRRRWLYFVHNLLIFAEGYGIMYQTQISTAEKHLMSWR